MIKFIFLHAIVLFHFLCVIYAQPSIDWTACYGGTDMEAGNRIIQTPDSGFIVCGQAASNDSDVSGNLGEADVWLIKLDQRGAIQWQRCYGGSEDESGYGIVRCADGSFVIASSSRSENGGMIQGHHDTTAYLNSDFWVFKVDNTGNLIWSQCYGGTSDEYASSISATPDGGFIIGGSAYSINWDVTGNHGNIDFWMVKIDSMANLQWQKCLGGTYMDYGHSIVVTNDSGFAIAGSTESTNGNVTNNHGSGDFWLARLDSTGNLLWQKCFGGSAMEDPYSLIVTNDGGFAIAGSTKSNDGDVTGYHSGEDFWIVKTDHLGILQWQKTLGGADDEEGHSIVQNANGEYVIAGITGSNFGDVIGNHGGTDFWIVNLDSMGNFQWQKCLGGSGYDGANAVASTFDGGWVVTGETGSSDYDAYGNNGYVDYLVIKLHSFNTSVQQYLDQNDYIMLSPNPTTGKLKINDQLSSSGKIEIYNTLGEKMIEINSSEADITSFPPGLYTILIYTGEKILRSKLVKE